MSKSKYVGLVVVFCGLLTVPVLGKWVYQGTDVWISQPTSDADPYGTWWYSWNGDGSVDADAFNLEASGWTVGECGVALSPYDGTPLSESQYVYSRARGQSEYRWDPNTGGSQEISFDIDTTLDAGSVTYDGFAIDDTHVSVASSQSGATAYGGGGVSTLQYFYDWGFGDGFAITQSGADADNTWGGGVTISTNDTDSGYPPPYLYNQYYEGELGFTATGYEDYTGTPSGSSFLVDATVGGEACAVGSITINDPNYHYLYLAAEASYGVIGQTKISLSGDIE